MAKRLFDLVAASLALVVLSPLLVCVGLGVFLADPGPVFYKARRAGRGNRPFNCLKFRTMRVRQEPSASRITAQRDPRVFWFGNLLRGTKIDELPQLVNILRGDMSIVGPRPEDAKMVELHYTQQQLRTLDVRPGLTSPASIYYYTQGEQLLDQGDPERAYVERLLPIKLAMELVYIERSSLRYDLGIIVRTVVVIVSKVLGRKQYPNQPEYARALELLEAPTAQSRAA